MVANVRWALVSGHGGWTGGAAGRRRSRTQMARGVVNGEVKVRDARNRAASVDGRLCVAVVLDVNEQAGRTEAEPGEELAVDGGNQELGRTLPSLGKKEGRRGNRKTLFVEGERAPCGRRIGKGKLRTKKRKLDERGRAGRGQKKENLAAK